MKNKDYSYKDHGEVFELHVRKACACPESLNALTQCPASFAYSRLPENIGGGNNDQNEEHHCSFYIRLFHCVQNID